ncbi:MAG TPA: hypothetical protein VM901_11935 [Bdellovibrionota bacterium]|jgi:hypothetical protein|nr:hypothetical protein [Bdellovibrionota bacterium]
MKSTVALVALLVVLTQACEVDLSQKSGTSETSQTPKPATRKPGVFHTDDPVVTEAVEGLPTVFPSAQDSAKWLVYSDFMGVESRPDGKTPAMSLVLFDKRAKADSFFSFRAQPRYSSELRAAVAKEKHAFRSPRIRSVRFHVLDTDLKVFKDQQGAVHEVDVSQYHADSSLPVQVEFTKEGIEWFKDLLYRNRDLSTKLKVESCTRVSGYGDLGADGRRAWKGVDLCVASNVLETLVEYRHDSDVVIEIDGND